MKLSVGPQFARGRLLYEQRRYDLAAKELRVASVADPSDPVPPAFLALSLVGLGRSTEALEAAFEAISRAPEFSFGHLALGYAYFSAGLIPQAEDAGREARRLNPYDSHIHILLARLAEKYGNWEEVLDRTSDALSSAPFDLRASVLRGNALVQLGRSGKAIRLLKDALLHSPEDASIHEGLGWSLLHVGERMEAVSHLREALRLNPLSEKARSGLAEAMKSKNRFYRFCLNLTLELCRSGSRRATVLTSVGIAYCCVVACVMLLRLPGLPWLAFGLTAGLAALMWHRLSTPLFDLALQLDPLGRRLLTAKERFASGCVGMCFALAAMATVAALWDSVFLWVAAPSSTLAPWLLYRVFLERAGIRRVLQIVLTVPAVVFGEVGAVLLALGHAGRWGDTAYGIGASFVFVSLMLLAVGGLSLHLDAEP